MSGLDPVLVAVAFLARPATLVRPAAGSWIDGRWTAAAPNETPITAVIQSPAPEDLVTLPEGERTGGEVTIWSSTALHTASEDDQTAADVVRAENGTEYRIIRASRRVEGGFSRAMGRRDVDRGRSL
jgi:hypothetical protein